jgi:hypothetical protein
MAEIPSNPPEYLVLLSGSDLFWYSFKLKAKRCKMEKMAISMQRSIDGMPTLRSLGDTVRDGFKILPEVRKEMISFAKVSITRKTPVNGNIWDSLFAKTIEK